MKLTPLDIHHKEFHRAIRGYNEEEVDNFLDQVAEEFERLFKENIDLKEQIEKHKEKAQKFETMQNTLQNALITAQKSADEVVAEARKEAEGILREAEVKTQQMLQEAEHGRETLEERFKDLKEAENQFRQNFRKMLESYLRLVEGEMPRPETKYAFPEKPVPTPAEEAEEASFEKMGEAEISMEGETPVQPAEPAEPKPEEPETGEEQEASGGQEHPGGGSFFNGPPTAFDMGERKSKSDSAPAQSGESEKTNNYPSGAGLPGDGIQQGDQPRSGDTMGFPTLDMTTATEAPQEPIKPLPPLEAQIYGYGQESEKPSGFGLPTLDELNSEATQTEPTYPTLEERDEELKNLGWLNPEEKPEEDKE